jgi:hypothetical protein
VCVFFYSHKHTPINRAQIMLGYDTPRARKELTSDYKIATGFSHSLFTTEHQEALRQKAEFLNACIKHSSMCIKGIFMQLKLYINFYWVVCFYYFIVCILLIFNFHF